MNVQRGDVAMVKFPFADGRTTKVRPAVVVQNDRNNQRLDNVILVQVTSRLGPPNELTRFVIDPKTAEGALSGLSLVSVVSCENLVTVQKDRILKVTGHLAEADQRRLDASLKASLSLD